MILKKELKDKFKKARSLFPHTKNVIYLNSASYSPFSTLIKDTVDKNMQVRMKADYDESHDAFAVRNYLRKEYAKLIGAKNSEVGLGMNTTFGLNIAAFGLPLKRGDEVILSDVEFPALVYTWRGAAEERGLKLKFIKSKNLCYDIDALEKAITKRTKVIAVSFVQFFNGYKLDLKRISDICKKYNLYFVVDGIQGMGVEPINVRKLGIDIFSSGCQKWMLSPQGCGFFYIKDELRDLLKKPFMGWLGVDWKMKFNDLFKYDLPYFKSAEKYELGFYAVLNLLGMKASLSFFKDLGIQNIQKHNYQLIDILIEYISNSDFYSVTSSCEKKHRSSIFTFTCPNYHDLQQYLLKNKIIVVPREGSVRVSVHLFNNEKDIHKLISLLDDYPKK